MGECMVVFVRKSDVAKLSWFDFADLMRFITKWDGARWRWLEQLFNDHFSKLDRAKFRELKDNLIGKCKFECYIENLIKDSSEYVLEEIEEEFARWDLYNQLYDLYEIAKIDVVIVSDYTNWPKQYRENGEYVSGEELLTIARNAVQKFCGKSGAMEQNKS